MVRYVDTARLRRRVRLSKRYKRFGRNVQDVNLHKMSLWALWGELGASYWDGNTEIVLESCEMTVCPVCPVRSVSGKTGHLDTLDMCNT
jgi:hypothetical protein